MPTSATLLGWHWHWCPLSCPVTYPSQSQQSRWTCHIGESMQTSTNITNLVKALLVAHRAMPSLVIKNAENALYNNRYADLGAVIEVIKPKLLDAGIIVMQSPGTIDEKGNVYLTSRIMHESGEWIEDVLSMPITFLDPHSFGTAVAYARRYALVALFLLYQADDDGNAASGVGALPSELQGATSGQDKADNGGASSGQPPAEESDPAVAKRVRSWLNTIENASLQRLLTSRPTAKTNFSGDNLKKIEDAFDKRIKLLQSQSQASDSFSTSP